MRAVPHHDLDKCRDIRSDAGGPSRYALWRPVLTELVVRRHVIALCGVLPVAGGAHMRCNTLPGMENFDRARGDARPQLFLQQLIGHRVIMPVDGDVVIEPGAALLPFRINVRSHRQRLQGRLVQLFEQLLATGAEMARGLVVEPVEQRADGRVHLCEAEELAIAQSRNRTKGAPQAKWRAFSATSTAQPTKPPPRPLPCPSVCAAARAPGPCRNAWPYPRRSG